MSEAADRARAYAEAAALEGMDPGQAAALAAEAVTRSLPTPTVDPFGGGPPSGTRFMSLGAAIMQARNAPPIRWVVKGLIPAGLTMLVGPPKIGKSFISLDLAFSVAAGGNVFGTVPTIEHDTLYVALEDNKRRINNRVELLEPDTSLWPLERMSLVTQDEVVPGYLSGTLNEWHGQASDPGMVIIDTLGSYETLIAATQARQQQQRATSYQADVQLLRPLQKWALTRNVAVVLIHHTNQSAWVKGEDWTNKASGTSGLTGTADNLMLMKGERGDPAAEMLIVGREIEDKVLTMTRVGAWWMVTGGMR